MRHLNVKSRFFEYRVVTGCGAWRELRALDRSRYSTLFVLTERKLWRRWGGSFKLTSGLGRLPEILVPPGEESKSLKMVERVVKELASRGADRSSLLIAFGGGVMGDLGGFVASVYMRGIDCIQVPTTVVAQVDSAIGGKTAVDVGAAKNLVGTFYPPRLVVAEPRALSSLDLRTFRSGFYEVVKHAFISGEPFCRFLEKWLSKLTLAHAAALEPVLARAAKVKVEVVNRDEREAGLRRVLNLGHTFGHAIEEATMYRRLLHGEGVGWGLLCSIRLAVLLGRLSGAQAERMTELVRKVGRLPSIKDLRVRKILDLLPRDKKAVGGRIHWVIPERIGRIIVTPDVPLELAARAFSEVQRLS
jgi:3-dehydroquinate synthase